MGDGEVCDGEGGRVDERRNWDEVEDESEDETTTG